MNTPDNALSLLRPMAEGFDGLGVAMCVFDDADCTVLWNRTFLKFFPEHAAHVRAGEPYVDNLRRFYRGRLGPEEMPLIERYVQQGLERHRTQQRPFSFAHRGTRLQVTAFPVPGAGRVRLWKVDVEAGPVDCTDDNVHVEPASTKDEDMPVIVESTLLDHVADGVMVTDAGDRILWVNEPFVSMYGVPARAAAVGSGFTDVYRAAWKDHTSDEEAPLFERGLATLVDNMRFSGAPFELPLPGDRWSRVVAQRSPEGKGFFVHVDITLLKRQHHQLSVAEARARESEAQLQSKSMLLEATLDRMEQGIMMVNADRVVEVCNRRAIELLDLPRELMASRPTFGQVLAHQWASDEFMHTPQDVLDFVRAGGILDRPHRYDRMRPNGQVIEIQSVPIEGGGIVRTYADITERKRSEERIRHMAQHDGLTALTNREVFLEGLQRATEESQSTGEIFAVYFIDLDKFKSINDHFGHAVGDKVLVQVAELMRRLVDASDVVGRLGGDEFAILRRQVDGPAGAMNFAQALLDGFRTPLQIEGHVLHLGTSVGVGLYPTSGTEADVLLRAADAAMYLAKSSGSGRALLFVQPSDACSETVSE
ncbi:MAG: sensor-containing diguanylate cyclase/phosphodiesterase [Variovorax sp.]|nr:sensor-containing diguanylate cyclase/phosphodiesterase [Variovorax sp.]